MLFIDNVPGHSKALIEIKSEINIMFIPVNATLILKPIKQEIIQLLRFVI